MRDLHLRLADRFPKMPLADRDWIAGLVSEAALMEADDVLLDKHGAALDLLRELAEDRHDVAVDPDDGEPLFGHSASSTLRTCADRLCDEVAQLLKGGS